MSELDLIPVSQLESNFGIKKTVLAERRAALGIKAIKSGRNSFISKADYDLLLELNDWIRSGKTTPEFLRMKGLDKEVNALRGELHSREHYAKDFSGNVRPIFGAPEISAPSTGSLALSSIDRSFVQLVHEIAAALALRQNPIEHWFTLERAASANFLLKSKEVQQLIGVKPAGDRMTRGSFVFIRQGKIGSSTAWRIEKLSAVLPEETSGACKLS